MPPPSTKHRKIEQEKNPGRVVLEDIAEEKESVRIPVFNSFTDELPDKFTYITKNSVSHETAKLLADNSEKQGCSCGDEGCGRDCECEKISTISFNPQHRIVTNPLSYNFYADFYVECHLDCGCRGKCKRQIFPGKSVLKKLEVHYIPGKKFGVLAAQPIAAGMPIAEYIGEVFIEASESEIYPSSDYQQELLTDNNYNHFIIDARRMGNISRFINHSCFNNVLQICVYSSIPTLDRCPPLPKVALVAFRDILPGQELNFDYQFAYLLDRAMPCLCYELGCVSPPYDYPQKVKSVQDTENEIKANKKAMIKMFDKAKDIEEVIELD